MSFAKLYRKCLASLGDLLFSYAGQETGRDQVRKKLLTEARRLKAKLRAKH
jgi:hypothetical protein